MQRINITRTARKEGYTIGKMFVNGTYVCDTLELYDRTYFGEDFKLGTSAVPVGIYRLSTTEWSPRFQKPMPRIMDFQESRNILIHVGNYPKDTEGCILVGKNSVVGMVCNSRTTFEHLQQMLNRHETWKLIID